MYKRTMGHRISYKRTPWDDELRSFNVDLKTGKGGEKIVAEKLRSFPSVVEVRDISDSKRGIADDIDFEVVYKDGHTCTVEVKTDLKAHKTGNFVYEEFSHMNPGCFARTKADHILYLVLETGTVYVINPKKFRAFIAEMKKNPAKAASLRVREVPMGEGAYGYLVPIQNLKTMSDVVECEFDACMRKAQAA